MALANNTIALDDLIMNISDSNNQYSPNSIGNGIYQHAELFNENDKNYRLEIERDGANISAKIYALQITVCVACSTLVIQCRSILK